MHFALPPECAGSDAEAALTAFVRRAGIEPHRIADWFCFGSDPDMMDRLAKLVVTGPKRATTFLHRRLHGGQRLPAAGDLCLVIAGGCSPRAVIRVSAVDVKPFIAIDAADAWDEGEGDRSLAYWRSEHAHYFIRETEDEDAVFDERERVVFVRFELVWPIGTSAARM